MTKLSALEKREPDETANIAEMADILRRKMQDHKALETRPKRRENL